MLLSKQDKIRFIELYVKHTHLEIAEIFKTNSYDIMETAKLYGIYNGKKARKPYTNWSVKEVEYLKKNLSTMNGNKIAQNLNKSPGNVYAKIRALQCQKQIE